MMLRHRFHVLAAFVACLAVVVCLMCAFTVSAFASPSQSELSPTDGGAVAEGHASDPEVLELLESIDGRLELAQKSYAERIEQEAEDALAASDAEDASEDALLQAVSQLDQDVKAYSVYILVVLGLILGSVVGVGFTRCFGRHT